MSDFPVTERRRMHERGSHNHSAAHAVLDAAPMCHVGYVIDGEPYVTPTIHWRDGNRVYWHGSSASRFLRKVNGQRTCLTVSLMDGYVLARSAFNHSVNYRSAMIFGRAQSLTNPDEITAALRHMLDDLFPARWETLRPMSAQELKASTVIWMDIEEASVNDRAAPPGDDDEAGFRVWAGILPMTSTLAPAEPAPGPHKDLALPEGLARLIASGNLR